jgi:hypothetical protein
MLLSGYADNMGSNDMTAGDARMAEISHQNVYEGV